MKNLKGILVLSTVLLLGIFSNAQIAPVDDNGLALGGYDVVAYFSDGATQGVADFAVEHDRATYYFASQENKVKFQENPDAYLPQFDGFCAWGVSEKRTKFPINPEAFDIVDGKLYLFFKGPFNGQEFDTLSLWNQETSRMVEDSQKNWPSLTTGK